MKFQKKKFRQALVRQIGLKTIRESAKESRIAMSTLQHLKKTGRVPDLVTFIKVCKWLGVPVETFVS